MSHDLVFELQLVLSINVYVFIVAKSIHLAIFILIFITSHIDKYHTIFVYEAFSFNVVHVYFCISYIFV